ncbi:hypothetical protein BDZ89DRAFT_1122487 [Hymenopellis radicata]|nr:hypothetical protein BDZ89DRAFT_1122487 [Hymenopellis radicata]
MATTVVNETKPQPQSLPTAALAYKYVTFVHKMTTGYYILGNGPLSSWRPNLDIGWYYLGQGAESNWDQAPPTGIIVHALEPDALRDVVGWERVWDNAGMEGPDFALWRGVPPNDDYVVVGGIFSENKGHAEPDSLQKRGIKAIRRDLLVMDATFPIWYAAALPPVLKGASVWKTLGVNLGASPSALIPVDSHSAPPRDISFSLDRNKTLLIESRDESTVSEGANLQKKDVDTLEGERKE